LINLKRVAYGVRDVDVETTAPVRAAPKAEKREVISSVVDAWIGKKSKPVIHGHVPLSDVKPIVRTTPAVPQPPLSSYRDLQHEASKPKTPVAPAQPVPFVCEEDVRTALRKNSQILVGKKTIITPSARDLGDGNHVFVISE
jgi:hypothetical protein